MLESLLGSHWRYVCLAVQQTYLKILKHPTHRSCVQVCLASHTSFFIQFSRYTPRGGHFALRFVHIVLCVRTFTRYELYGLPVCCSFRRGYFVRTRFGRELLPVQPVVGSNGLEPSTSRLSGVRSNHLSYEPMSVAGSDCHCGQPVGGDEQNRTVDPLLARQVLSQLSYTPIFRFASLWVSCLLPPFCKGSSAEGLQN